MELSVKLILPHLWKLNRGFNRIFPIYFAKRSIASATPISQKWGSNKKHRDVKLKVYYDSTVDPETNEILAPLRASVKEQGDLVRKLKSEGASVVNIKEAVTELNARKKALEDKEFSLVPHIATFDRARLEALLKRRHFIKQADSLYGGIAGVLDFGPVGSEFMDNFLQAWKRFFVHQNQMFQVKSSILTSEAVFKASGHVERFADLMVKDVNTGECFRLDHLIKAQLEKIADDKNTNENVRTECHTIITKVDRMSKEEMVGVMQKYSLKSPSTGNDLTEPTEFNLMFETKIGPSVIKGFLRPELAQGIFINFQDLLDENHGRLPFAAYQIGNVYRNEISPKSGLIRSREFTVAEIEHFCDPDDKSHPKFDTLKDTPLLLYSACNQMDGKPAERLTIGAALDKGLVGSQTLGYFMAQVQLFLVKCGVDPKRLRFRQHMVNEMAHYAEDCWDAECLTSFGWTECVGCADRSTFDLSQHSKASGIKLVARRKLPEPKVIDVIEVVPNKSAVSKAFGQDVRIVTEALSQLQEDQVKNLEEDLHLEESYSLRLEDRTFCLTKEMVAVKKYQKTAHVEEIIPCVIEPSFGVGRIMYAILEHNFRVRESDEKRTYLSLPAAIAPIKCGVFPLGANAELVPFVKLLSDHLTSFNISHKVDDYSGTIGRRYTRSDEIAIPFAVTIDFDTLEEPHTVTLRERDSMAQVRIPVEDVAPVLNALSFDKLNWKDVTKKYPKFEQESKSL